MVRVWNESGDSSKDRERLDLEVGGGCFNGRFVESNMRVVFFVHVEVFNESFFEKVVEGYDATFEELAHEVR